MMLSTRTLVLAALAFAGCAAPDPAPTTLPLVFDASFTPEVDFDTDRVHLEVLDPIHTDLDYAAFMGSREHLRRTLEWGPWPKPDMTLEANAKDLANHRKEFDAHEAYAYTVQSTDRSRCVGCIYLDPVEGQPHAMQFYFWVIEPELSTDLDSHLLISVLGWIERAWPGVDEVIVPLRPKNERGQEIARNAGLERVDRSAYPNAKFKADDVLYRFVARR